jgi:hypothetical protein
MTWLTVMEYLCHKWPRICSTCRKHFPVLSSFTTYYRVYNLINTMGATSGAGTAYLSRPHELTPGFYCGSCYSIFSSICMFCKSLFVLLFFFLWPLCCLFFFDIRLWLPLWYLQTLLTGINSVCLTRVSSTKKLISDLLI